MTTTPPKQPRTKTIIHKCQRNNGKNRKSENSRRDTKNPHSSDSGNKTRDHPPTSRRIQVDYKNRPNREGGGVALLIREDIVDLIKEVTDVEDYNQEILWIQTKEKRRKLSIGVFYGLQEKERERR